MGTEMMVATNSGTARAEVLRRIRVAKGGTSDTETAGTAWSRVAREYRRSAVLEPKSLLELLEDRLRDYDAHVVRVGYCDVADAVAKMLAARGKRRLVVPAGLAAEWLPAGFEFVRDDGMSSTALDAFDGVMTGSTVAIAVTGTVILQNVPGQGRRAVTLVPDYHLCIVNAADVVETIPQAMDRLHETAKLTTTFFSGPSATADIEMTRIKGVHGPRHLDVILIV
ncbi:MULTISPECIES: LUD domain-containing protein [Acidobacteriaceae]|uniref:LutC/YkgG family protein n=1 Tax=Acidobacteriaceae TaxID=204434 RepID=UPI00131DCCBD|nr:MULTISPECIES: LUD domain-containing protein [Acidobacteriaceae]MDW5266196.1 LUD domain-containing protein [Edaphobacter sp.]